MTETDKAWLAGFVDGEGTFAISTAHKDRHFSFRGSVSASSTDISLVERCRSISGVGYITTSRPSSPRAKRSFSWVVKPSQVVPVVDMLLPYLVGKYNQARILKEFRSRLTTSGAVKGRFGQEKRTPAKTADLERFKLAMSALNKRGIAPISDAQRDALASVMAELGLEAKTAAA